MAGMNPEFNQKGTTTEQKLDHAQKALDQAKTNLALAVGAKAFDPKWLILAERVAEASMYERHFRKAVEKAAAEKRAREEAEKKAQALQAAISQIAAKLGTTDPDKILAAFRAAGAVA